MLRSSQVVRLIFVIALLLAGGGLGFLGLSRTAAVGDGSGGAAAGRGDVFAVVVAAGTAAAFAGAWVATALVRRSGRAAWDSRADDEAALQEVHRRFAAVALIQGALIEAGGLLGAIGVLVTGNGLLLLASAAAVAGLGITFPRTGTLERWVEEVTGGASDVGAEATENA